MLRGFVVIMALCLQGMLSAAAPAGAGDHRAHLSMAPLAFVAQPLLLGTHGRCHGSAAIRCPALGIRKPVRLAVTSPRLGLVMQAGNKFEIEGTIIDIKKPQSFPSGFVKREFVIRTDEMYPQEVKFELFKDKISLIDSYQVNDQIKVSFNIRGSQWEGRYFTNLQAWRIERMAGDGQLAAQADSMDLSEWDGYGSQGSQSSQAMSRQSAPAAPKPAPAKAPVQWDDDIPF